MAGKTPNTRTPECEVDSMFTDRWSPRAFLSDPLPEQQIKSLFEAARWAPSCFNIEKAYEVLGVSKDEYHVMAAIAVGRKDESIDELPEDLRAMESPNPRKAPSEVATDKFPISG